MGLNPPYSCLSTSAVICVPHFLHGQRLAAPHFHPATANRWTWPWTAGLKLQEAFGANVRDWAPTRCLGCTCPPLPLHRTNISILIEVPIGFWMGPALWAAVPWKPFQSPTRQKKYKAKTQSLSQTGVGSNSEVCPLEHIQCISYIVSVFEALLH